MFSKHIILKNNNEEELILFIDLHYEFGNFDKNNKQSIKECVKKYIKDKNIKFNGKKILLVTGGVLIATLIINNQNFKFSNFNEENIITYVEELSIKKVEDVPIIKKEKVKQKNTKLEEKSTKQTSFNSNNNVTNKHSKNNNSKTNSSKKNSSKITLNKNNSTKSNSTNTSKKNTASSNTKKATTVKKEEKVTVYRSNGKVENLSLEEYVVGVVAAELPASFNIEAIKAQAILARTYALKSKSTNKKLTDTVSTQAYIDVSQMKKKWGGDYSKYYKKIKDAVSKTSGMYITYNGEIIDAVYHSTSNGYTEDSIEVWGYSVPYLKIVSSTWDKKVNGYEKTIIKEESLILKLFGIDSLQQITITKRNSSRRVSEVKVGDNIYSGIDIREMLGLRSTDFDLKIENDKLIITTRGYGHGVGMSQYGANEMAKLGKNYKEIINHYYTGVKIIKK